MNFGQALEEIQMPHCHKLARAGWNGKDMYIFWKCGSSGVERVCGSVVVHTRPYLMMFTADRQLVPWLASQSDLLADDWEIVLDCRDDAA